VTEGNGLPGSLRRLPRLASVVATVAALAWGSMPPVTAAAGVAGAEAAAPGAEAEESPATDARAGVRTGAAAVAELDALIGDGRYLQAAFTQTVLDPAGGVLQQSSGRFVAARPQQLNWEVTAPSAQRLVTDGHTVWLYDADLAQVTVGGLDEADVEAPMLVLGGRTGELLDRYTIAAESDGARARFVLTPRDGAGVAAAFTSLEVEFGDGLIRAMRVVDALDQRTQFTFSDVSRPDAVDAATFSFVVPAGVDVVRR
jgi:outer membrane lipoprotein carrier protein